jgi:hypothetical protein
MLVCAWSHVKPDHGNINYIRRKRLPEGKMELSMRERRPITREFAARYRAAKTKAEKSRILTNFTAAAAGFNRKYAVGILGDEGRTMFLRLDKNRPKLASPTRPEKRVYGERYGPDVVVCAIYGCGVSQGMCGKRLVSLIGANILAGDPHFHSTPEVREKLVWISRSTVERILNEERKKQRFKEWSTIKPGSLLKRQITVQVFWA